MTGKHAILVCCLVALTSMTSLAANVPTRRLKQLLHDYAKASDDTELWERSTVEEIDGNFLCPYFDVIEGMALYGFNTRIIDSLTSLGCMEACAKEEDFYCRSADYNYSSERCYLSSENDETQGRDFSDNFNTVYFRRRCDPPSTSPDDGGSTDEAGSASGYGEWFDLQ